MKTIIVELPDSIHRSLELHAKDMKFTLEDYAMSILIRHMSEGTIKKTRQLSAEQHFEEWFKEDKVREHTNRFKAKDIYIYYHRWCQKNGHEPMHINQFGKHLSYTDIPKTRDSLGFNYWATCDGMWLEELKYKDPAAYKTELDNREIDEALARSENIVCQTQQHDSVAIQAASIAPVKPTVKHMPKPPRSERNKDKQPTTAHAPKKR